MGTNTQSFMYALLLAASSGALAHGQGTEPVTTTDLLKIEQISHVSFSPDGSRIAYVVRRIETDGEEDYAYRNDLHLVRADGSEAPRQLTFSKDGASDPAWHPAGDRIAFVRTVEDKPQVFVLSLEGGEPFQLTLAPHGASSPRWSPGGERILFTSRIDHSAMADAFGDQIGNPPWDVERPGRTPGDAANWRAGRESRPEADPDGDLQARREWLARNAARDNPRVVTRLNFLGETDLSPEPAYTHVFVQEADPEAEPVPVTGGYFSFASPAWTAEGRIVFSGSDDPELHPDRDINSDLFIAEADGGGYSTLLSVQGWSVFGPVPSPDGRSVAFQARQQDDLGYRQMLIGVVGADGAGYELLTAGLDRSQSALTWSPDSRDVHFVAPTNGGIPLYRVPREGGPAARLSGLTGGVQSYDVSRNRIAYVLTEIDNPFELYVADYALESPVRLTSHNAHWIAGKRLSRPEARTLTRPDGTVVEYWLMKPADYREGERYPLMLQIHGGPSAMWGPGEATMWHEFQLVAANRYGIVYANPRGSGGYGYEFQRGNYQDWGHTPAGDVLAAVDAAVEEPWVDPERLVITGGSYAGYLTAWIIAHDHRFRAAAAQRGVYELTAFLGEGNAWRLVPYHFGGYPWEEEYRRILLENSPQTYVERIRTPLLILHADTDLRTGVSQSELLYKSLKILERPVEYVRYPNASHDMSRTGHPLQRMDRLLRILEFMERFVRE